MLNTKLAKQAIENLDGFRIKEQENALEFLTNFVDAVEHLMTHNSIKQIPAIFTPYDKLGG